MKYKIITEQLTVRHYEVEGSSFKEACLELMRTLKEETNWVRNPKINPVDEITMKEHLLVSKKRK